MSTLVSTLHVGCVNGKPLRLYRSPIPGTQLPWHAWNDLQACMDLSEDMRAYLHRCLMTDWSADVRTVATADGIVTIAPHGMAQGIIAAITEATNAGPALTIAYQQQMFDAWNTLTNDMPATASMEMLGVAVRNSLAHGRPT